MERSILSIKGIFRRMIDIILDDCMNVMKKYEDNHFDLAIVDPPYRNQNENQPTKDMRNNSKSGNMKDFGNKPDKEFFEQLFRVSKNQIIWGANNFTENLPNHKGFVIWRKLTISEKFTMSMCEYAFLSEGLSTTSKLFEYHPQDKDRIHPTQKPIKLYEWLLKHYAEKEQKILDTHLGSGSIAIACHNFGVDLVGVEIDPEYYEKAKNRIDKETRQESLF